VFAPERKEVPAPDLVRVVPARMALIVFELEVLVMR
jgi:hypothetical protein